MNADPRARGMPDRAPSSPVGDRLVTLAEFAAFVRRDDGYFNAKNWPDKVFRGVAGGDAILELIAFRWLVRDQPVRGVTWFEAAAYCRWKNAGHLPIAAERRAPRPPARWGFRRCATEPVRVPVGSP